MKDANSGQPKAKKKKTEKGNEKRCLAPDGAPPETFQPKVRKQNQIGFWNISSRLTSAASFNKIG